MSMMAPFHRASFILLLCWLTIWHPHVLVVPFLLVILDAHLLWCVVSASLRMVVSPRLLIAFALLRFLFCFDSRSC